MMAGGIVMVSFVPIALLVAMVGSLEKTACSSDLYYGSAQSDCGRFNGSIYGGLLTAGVLMGVGIPMIVIGGKREPLGSARLTPWATPHAAGLGFRIEL
jgi:hypothetical protein